MRAARGIATLSRNRIVLASKIATVVLLLVLGITLFWAEARFLTLDFYVFKLAVCFLLFLSAFHWFFGAMRNLTTTQVRLIDYAYLGIAALGIFVLAMNQEEKRYAYRQVDSQNFGRRTIEKTIANLENS